MDYYEKLWEMINELDDDVIEALNKLISAGTDLEVAESLINIIALYNFNPCNLEVLFTTIDFCEDYPKNDGITEHDKEKIASSLRDTPFVYCDDINQAVTDTIADNELEDKVDI